MNFNIRLILFLSLLFACAYASAQAPVALPKKGDRSYGGAALNGGTLSGRPSGATIDVNSIPMDYGKYSDSNLKELERQMEERDWASEGTAWQRACAIDTKDSYQKYVARFPYGAHRAEADKKIVDFEVEDIFNGEHGNIPEIRQVSRDDESETSTIVVENATSYMLTVMYSGAESKSIRIAPGCRGSVTLVNGDYRIAASVPVASIRPYAGSQGFTGGRYETGYCVVRSW